MPSTDWGTPPPDGNVSDLNDEPAPTPASSQPTVTLTIDELDALVKKAVAAGVQESNAAAEKAAAEKAAAIEATTSADEVVTPSSWPYGNRDKKRDFDLSRMTSLNELPADKVVVAIPAFNMDSDGKPIGFDLKNTRIQFLDPEAYRAASTTDKKTGATTFQLLSVDPIVLHDPSR